MNAAGLYAAKPSEDFLALLRLCSGKNRQTPWVYEICGDVLGWTSKRTLEVLESGIAEGFVLVTSKCVTFSPSMYWVAKTARQHAFSAFCASGVHWCSECSLLAKARAAVLVVNVAQSADALATA